MEKDMKYCNYCGKQIEDEQLCDCRKNATSASEKQVLMKKVLVIGGVVLAVITIVLSIILSGNKDQNAPTSSSSPEGSFPISCSIKASLSSLI